jgi:hypothetical protein
MSFTVTIKRSRGFVSSRYFLVNSCLIYFNILEEIILKIFKR